MVAPQVSLPVPDAGMIMRNPQRDRTARGASMRPGARMLVLQTKRWRTALFMNPLMEVETIAVLATRHAGKRLAELDLAAVDQALDGLECPPAPRFFRRVLGSVLR